MDWILFFIFSFFWFFLGSITGKKIGELFSLWIKSRQIAINDLLMFGDWVLFSIALAACVLFMITGFGYFVPGGLLTAGDVIQTLIFLITFFTLFYSSIVRDGPRSKRMEPKISIDFLQAEPDCHKTFEKLIVSNSFGTINGNIDAYYVRFRVKNSGKTTLQNVEVILEEVKSDILNTSDFLPLNLTWTLTENSTERNVTHIPQGSFRIIDLCKVLKDTDVIRAIVSLKQIQFTEPRLQRIVGNIGICSTIKPNTYSDILPASSYIFHVSISAENALPLFAKFAVSFDHVWSDDPAIMFTKHLTVSLIKSGPDRDEIFA